MPWSCGQCPCCLLQLWLLFSFTSFRTLSFHGLKSGIARRPPSTSKGGKDKHPSFELETGPLHFWPSKAINTTSAQEIIKKGMTTRNFLELQCLGPPFSPFVDWASFQPLCFWASFQPLCCLGLLCSQKALQPKKPTNPGANLFSSSHGVPWPVVHCIQRRPLL